MNDEILAFNFTVAETDVILAALEEKAQSISNLRQRIYDNASMQITNIQEAKMIKEETETKKKKGKNGKQKNNM